MLTKSGAIRSQALPVGHFKEQHPRLVVMGGTLHKVRGSRKQVVQPQVDDSRYRHFPSPGGMSERILLEKTAPHPPSFQNGIAGNPAQLLGDDNWCSLRLQSEPLLPLPSLHGIDGKPGIEAPALRRVLNG